MSLDCGNAEYLERIHTALNMWQKSGLCADNLSHCCEFQKHWNRTQPVIIIISISESYYDELRYCSYFDINQKPHHCNTSGIFAKLQ